MRSISSGIEHTVSALDGKTIRFDDGELDAYGAKQNYEIKIEGQLHCNLSFSCF